jgi:nitrite reductase (NO-forming)
MLGTVTSVDRRLGVTRSATSRGLGLAGALAVAAAVAAVAGADRWVVVHLFVAGAGSVAVSAAAVHLAVTWSGAPAPPAWASGLQRWVLAVGVVTVVIARPADADAAVVAGATAVAAGLTGLTAILVQSTLRARQQRYRTQVWSYAVASAVGCGGVVLGGLLATGHAADHLWRVHPVVMVWGFIGTVVVATLPTFAATTLRMKPSPRLSQPRLAAVVAAFVGGTGLATVAAWADATTLGAAGLGVVAAALFAVALLLPRPTRRSFDYSGPRGVGIGAATTWWIGVTVWAAARVAGGEWPTGGRPLVALVIGGLGQLVWAAVAYFAPVLRAGGPDRLAQGFALMRSWISLAAWNAAAVAAAAGAGSLAAGLVAVVVVDSACRVALLLRPAQPSTGSVA